MLRRASGHDGVRMDRTPRSADLSHRCHHGGLSSVSFWRVLKPEGISDLLRCIAMVMIWNTLAGGDPNLCAIIVIVNSVLQIILYSPMALFFIKVISKADDIPLAYGTTAIAVLIVRFFLCPKCQPLNQPQVSWDPLSLGLDDTIHPFLHDWSRPLSPPIPPLLLATGSRRPFVYHHRYLRPTSSAYPTQPRSGVPNHRSPHPLLLGHVYRHFYRHVVVEQPVMAKRPRRV